MGNQEVSSFFPKSISDALGSRFVYFAPRGARQKSRTSKEGKKEERKEGRKEGGKGREGKGREGKGREEKKEGKKVGGRTVKRGNRLGGALLEEARSKRRTQVDGR